MSDVAPSPTPSGEPVDDAVQPVAPGGAQDQGGKAEEQGAPGEVAPERPKPRQRKEKLPGVVSRDDADDLFPDLGFKSNRKPGKRIGRDEALRELDAEMKGEGMQEVFDFVEPPPGEEKPESEAQKQPQKFKFADKEYESQEQAEQSFKSLQGMFKPMQERLTTAESVAQKNAESARLWRARAQELEAGTPPPTPQPQTPQASAKTSAGTNPQEELDAALKNVNGEMFESLAREHGLPIAGRYLAAQVLATVHDQMLPRLRDEILAQIQPELEPLKQDRGFQQATQHVAGLIEQVGEYRNTDGELAFPELGDPQTVYEIGDLWRSMDMPAEIALTPKGLLQAVALYRMYRGQPQSQAATSTASAEMSRPTATAPPTAGQSLEAGRAPSPVRAKGESPETRFGRSLDDAPLVDPILGFSVRRRR